MAHVLGNLQLLIAAERVVGDVDIVRSGGQINAGIPKLANSRRPSPHFTPVGLPANDKADVGVADETNACLGDEIDDPVRIPKVSRQRVYLLAGPTLRRYFWIKVLLDAR